MNRRTFALALGAAALGAPGLRAGARRFKVGVLGAGHSHAAPKIKLLGAHPRFELIGVAEDSAAVRKSYAGLNWISREEVLARSEVVFIESEVRDHAHDALAALRAGRHVHVEKPPSAQWNEVKEMIELARKEKLLFQTGYMWRYNPGMTAIFAAVRGGWLGEVYQVRAMMNNQLPRDRRAEWGEFKGGAFFEQASHLVDAVVRLLGQPLKATPILQSREQDSLVCNNAAVLEYPKALAIITNATHQPNAGAHRMFEVLGTNGTMTLRPIEPPVLEVDFAKPAGPYQAGQQSIPMPKYERYAGDIDDLAAALAGEKPLAASLDDELLVQEWVLRASGMWEP